MHTQKSIVILLGLLILTPGLLVAESVSELLQKKDFKQITAMREQAIPDLIDAYRRSTVPEDKAYIASIFYKLGILNAEVEEMLMADVHTSNASLRLQVQWALGRVSRSPVVVSTLLDTMRNDSNALFRDKAACALAYDQIHLSTAEKAVILDGLIEGLEDEKQQVRNISILALKIHTGQHKEFKADADTDSRAAAVQRWKIWFREYQANL